jgi:hypothetical protein
MVGTGSVFLAGSLVGDSQWSSQGNLASTASRDIRSTNCVYTDAVSLTIAADIFAPATPRCPGWIDGRGVALTMTPATSYTTDFYPNGFRRLTQWQAATLRQLQAADVVLTRQDPATNAEWAPAPRRYVRLHFHRVAHHDGQFPWQLWVRDTPRLIEPTAQSAHPRPGRYSTPRRQPVDALRKVGAPPATGIK